jgi:uncharacterized membrane protein HdeD (DUF308 family)
MDKDLKAAAWALGLWGALSVVFGALILAWPGITLKAFLVVLGVYLLASGAVLLVGSLINRNGHWVIGTLIGFLSAVAGLYVFANPQISALVALSVVAIWAVAAGMLLVVSGFEGKNDWWRIIAGAVYTLFGFYIFANPAGGAIALVWLIGLSTIASGVALIVTAFHANSMGKVAKR